MLPFRSKIKTIIEKPQHIETGKLGEEIAGRFLLEKNFQILDKNYRHRHHEIDIVCQDENELVIVEVKTRRSNYLSEPQITVSTAKQKSLVEAANAYIRENEIDLDCRFDIVSVLLLDGEKRIEHLKDAFRP